ncbi:unnamed protein product, partial [Rotaria sp. Silwood2]
DENTTTINRPLSVLSRISSLPTRLFLFQRNNSISGAPTEKI